MGKPLHLLFRELETKLSHSEETAEKFKRSYETYKNETGQVIDAYEEIVKELSEQVKKSKQGNSNA